MNIGLIAAGIGVVALIFAFYLSSSKINSVSAGTKRMEEISTYIQEGAMAFMKREYKSLLVFGAVVAAVIIVGIGWETGVSFILGASFSGAAGFIGMRVATKANVRTANAAKESGMNRALSVAFSGGAVMGMSVVGLGLLGLGILYTVFGNQN